MVEIYIKQRVFAFGAKYDIYDQNENQIYYAESEIFTIGAKIHLYDMNKVEVCYAYQELFHLMPCFYLDLPNGETLEVNGKFALLRNKLKVKPIDWLLQGSGLTHKFEITDDRNFTVATIAKEWFTFGDMYHLKIEEEKDTLKVIALTLVLDTINDTSNASVTVSSSK